MKNIISFILLALAAASCTQKAATSSGTVIPLYDSVAPGSEGWTHTECSNPNPNGTVTLFNIAEPTLEVFVPEHPNGTGMLVLPGGGFISLSYDYEGTGVAQKLNEQGITAFVLKYRTAPLMKESGEPATNYEEAKWAIDNLLKDIADRGKPGSDFNLYDFEGVKYAFADANQAMTYIRAHASDYGLERIGMMGFSAGAITTLHQAAVHDSASRPDFAGVIYGGWEDDSYSAPDDAMPMFLCCVVNDVFFTPDQSLWVYKAWCASGAPVEYHSYYEAQHGFGIIPSGHSSDAWTDALFAFMRDVKFLE